MATSSSARLVALAHAVVVTFALAVLFVAQSDAQLLSRGPRSLPFIHNLQR
jgi:hypothetical protein